MKNNETMNVAKKLTLEEIKALPRASVVWAEISDTTDEGIVWHSVTPLLVCVPGDNGVLMGGDKNSFIDWNINNDLLNDSYTTIWSHEPARDQLRGISDEEYNTLTDEERIVFPKLAAAITVRGMTFVKFCENTGMNYRRFWKAITGEREFTSMDIEQIVTALDLRADEMMEIFFPEFVA